MEMGQINSSLWNRDIWIILLFKRSTIVGFLGDNITVRDMAVFEYKLEMKLS